MKVKKLKSILRQYSGLMASKIEPSKIRIYFLVFLIVNLIFCVFNHPIFTQETDSFDSAEGDSTQTVTLDYKDAELSSVLQALSYTYDLNLVTTKELEGRVTINLSGVTLDEALDAILKVNGYSFSKERGVIYILPGLNPEEMGLEVAIISLKYLSASEAEGLIQDSLSSKGKTRINEVTNSLVVTDYPQALNKIRKIVEEIDIQPIQVLIEAKIVDITSKDLENLGITFNPEYTDTGIFKSETSAYTNADEIDATVTMDGQSATLDGGQFVLNTFSIKHWDITATVDALIEDRKAHLLASPSIAALNGKEAKIIIGEKYPYKEKTQTTTGTTETTKFVEVGTTLRVTPQVSPDGYITMKIHPEVSSVSDTLDAGPRITTREADSTIRVKNGETIVIGGLIKREEDRKIGHVPFLGRLPFLSLLFSNRSKDLTQIELVVFITPRIIQDSKESEALRTTRQKEVYVNIEGRGERILIAQLWDQARNMERGEGIESRRKEKEARMADALDLYRNIASQFPGSEKADDALYRAGLISYDFFADLELSKNIFSELADRYPDSPYAWKSKRLIRHIDKKLNKRLKAKQRSLSKEKRKDFKMDLR